MTLKVGLIVGREWSFPPAFIEEVNRRDEGVVAEYVKLGAPHMDDPAEYAVIIDRISHEVPFYRTYLKQAALMGCAVVNNPFMWTADDKFFGAALATRLGIAHPKTAVLPNKEYIPGVVHEESLRNLQYPLDWQALVDYIGMPCILKDAHGGGWKDVYVCRSLEELIHHYDTSGLLTMIVQEFIEWDQFIRCICIGQDKVMPIKYDPKERRYHVEHDHLGPELGARVVADSLKLVRALGYDMNSMEWAVRDGIPYAIDFMNPAPDMDIYSLTPHYFEWAVQAMADMAISLAKNPRRQVKDLRWDALFTGSRETGEGGDHGTAGSASAGFAAQGGTASASAAGEMMGSDGRADASTAQSTADGGQHGSGAGGRAETSASAATTADDGGGYVGSGNRGGDDTAPVSRVHATLDQPPASFVDASAADLASPAEVPASAGTHASSGAAGSYVDPSPAADLEPPVEAETQRGGTEAGGKEGGGRASESTVEANERGNGRTQAAEDEG
ncbi:hypothetical protein SAMN05216486_10147 [bacterium JGI 053]|nr:hypothetical protein SAMN05216486_10147 [bacterium JGI 053]